MKKLTYEFVKEQFEKEGYKFLSKEYKNNSTKLELVCPGNHKCYIAYNNFQNGNRCVKCSNVEKHTYEYIKEQFEKDGYIDKELYHEFT